MLAPSIAHLSFHRDDGQALGFVPGQFLQVHFHYGDGTATKRSYSIATRGGDSVEIAVSYVPGGAATALFEGLEIGGQVQASGPFGRFCLQPGDANARYLLIATGTGVTPYRAMLSQLETLIGERGVEVVLLFGARNPDELLFVDVMRTGWVKARKLSQIMPWWYYRGMTDEDLKSMFAYLRTVPAIQHRVDNTKPATECPACGLMHGAGDQN